MVTDGMEDLLSLMEIDIAMILQMDTSFPFLLTYLEMMVNIFEIAAFQ